MPNWRCPHCRTPQPETARCWVCRRSTTTCGTCRYFHRAVATPPGGTCGLDFLRLPLRGDEMRGCWRPLVRWGRTASGTEALPQVDPLGPPLAVPGGLWAEPEG